MKKEEALEWWNNVSIGVRVRAERGERKGEKIEEEKTRKNEAGLLGPTHGLSGRARVGHSRYVTRCTTELDKARSYIQNKTIAVDSIKR